MHHTLVGVFDTPAAAMQARQELLSAGFANAEVVVLSSESVPATTGSSTSTPTAHEGGVTGFLKSLFGVNDTDQDVGLYSEAVRRGGYVLSVSAADDARVQQAEDIMQRYGSVDIDERVGQWRQQGWSGAAAGDVKAGGATTTIPVVQEDLRVGKRAVRRGGLRVFTRVIETPVQESVNLREEHATVQRRAVDRPATEADFAAMQGGTIEVRETVEEPVVAKSARVVEEIEVGKQVTEHPETVRDTVRHTEVQIEQLDRERIAASDALGSSTDTARTGDTGKSDKRPI